MTADRWWDQLAVVVELAWQTETRSDTEQRALLRVAHKDDRARSLETTTNPADRRVAPFLERCVDETRVLDGDDRRVVPPSEQKANKRKKAAA